MSLILPLVIATIAFVGLVTWLDFTLNKNDDATTIGQFEKFQKSFDSRGKK